MKSFAPSAMLAGCWTPSWTAVLWPSIQHANDRFGNNYSSLISVSNTTKRFAAFACDREKPSWWKKKPEELFQFAFSFVTKIFAISSTFAFASAIVCGTTNCNAVENWTKLKTKNSQKLNCVCVRDLGPPALNHLLLLLNKILDYECIMYNMEIILLYII